MKDQIKKVKKMKAPSKDALRGVNFEQHLEICDLKTKLQKKSEIITCIMGITRHMNAINNELFNMLNEGM